MAMEAIGSIMTIQAQAIQPVQVKQPVKTEQPAAEYQEGTIQAAAVDKKISIVENAQGADRQNQSNAREQQNNEQIRKAVEQLNKNMSHSEAVFGIHEATNRVTIKIIDKDTREVIKELPPEKTLDMIAKVWEMAGILVDEKR